MNIFGGIITSIAGVVMLGWPFDSILVLTIIAGVWLVALGTIQIVRAFQIRRDNRRAPQLPRYGG